MIAKTDRAITLQHGAVGAVLAHVQYQYGSSEEAFIAAMSGALRKGKPYIPKAHMERIFSASALSIAEFPCVLVGMRLRLFLLDDILRLLAPIIEKTQADAPTLLAQLRTGRYELCSTTQASRRLGVRLTKVAETARTRGVPHITLPLTKGGTPVGFFWLPQD